MSGVTPPSAIAFRIARAGLPPCGSGSVTWWESDEHAVAEYLGVDADAARLCAAELLEHQHGTALGQDEAFAAGVERTAAPSGSSFRRENARIVPKPPIPSGTTGASTRPASIASAMPARM